MYLIFSHIKCSVFCRAPPHIAFFIALSREGWNEYTYTVTLPSSHCYDVLIMAWKCLMHYENDSIGIGEQCTHLFFLYGGGKGGYNRLQYGPHVNALLWAPPTFGGMFIYTRNHTDINASQEWVDEGLSYSTWAELHMSLAMYCIRSETFRACATRRG